MTMFSKVLVFLNLLIGLAMLSWSVGLFTHKLEWIDRTGMSGEKIEGEITRLKTEADALTAQIKLASQRFGQAYASLEEAEQTRDNRLKVFEQRLVWARTGDPMGNGFFADVLLPGSSLSDTANLGQPTNGPDGRPLRGAETLSQTIEANDQAVMMSIAKIAKLKTEQDQLQRQEKLLQMKVDKHAAFFDQLLNEEIYLKAFEQNWFEQLGTVQRRKAQLVKRLAEFQQ